MTNANGSQPHQHSRKESKQQLATPLKNPSFSIRAALCLIALFTTLGLASMSIAQDDAAAVDEFGGADPAPAAVDDGGGAAADAGAAGGGGRGG